MAELPPHPLVLRVGRRADSGWHLALDISERCRKRDGLASVTVPLHGDHARLERWRRHYLFRINPAAYAERLAADCLTDADLAALLAEIPDHLATRTGPLPEDLRDLAALVEGDLFAETVVATTVSTGCSDPTHLVVLRLTAPIFAEAVGRLERSVTRLAASGTHVPFEPARAVALLTSQWLAQLTPLFLRTLALEVRIASLENKLHGETPEARFLDFAEGICTPERRRAFFLEYPVLARLVSRKLHHWVTFGLELLARLVNDWPDIVTTFFAGSDPGHVTSIVMGGGDSHQRGRSVVILRFERGVQLVYKPRSLAIDVHFQELLQWLNARLADASPAFPTFKTFRVIDRSDYGWCEFVASDTCDSPSQVTRFFMRQGANAALLHALNAVDFHSENVIAHGEHPALVDLETLFHPVVDLWSATQYRDPAAKMWSTTVVRLGLLPERAESSDGHVGYDISALGNRPGQVSAEPLPAITDAGTDLMRLTYKPIAIAVNDSIPTLQNERVDAAHYVPQIVDGFETMYRFLMKSREELVGGPFVAFRHDRVRHVVLATQLYDAILDTSLHPDYLRDAMERERILNRLWRVTKSDERFSRLFHAERADLLEGDIPYFWTYVDSCDLHDSRGDALSQFFGEPGYAAAVGRLNAFSEADLARQIWLIRSAFATVPLGLGEHRWKGHAAHPTNAQVTRDQLIALASKVGDRVLQLAVTEADHAGWLGVALIREREWQLTPLGFDLYNGASGIALFLAQLGAITRDARYTTMARAAVNSILSQMRTATNSDEPASIGAFTGLSAPLFLLAHLAVLWHEPALLDKAEELLARLGPHIDADTAFDVLDGAAGCIFALLALHRARPSAETLEAACRCGDHLVKNGHVWKDPSDAPLLRAVVSRWPRAGFAHGASGIALALLELSARSANVEYRCSAISGLEGERRAASPRRDSGGGFDPADRYTDKRVDRDHLSASWCHGAVGVGLSRVEAQRHLIDSLLGVEVSEAIDTTLELGFGLNHSLCHGDLGSLDFLQVSLGTVDCSTELNRRIAMVVQSIVGDGWLTGIPFGIESPGLMSGISGIGYGLLRLASPDLVPAILTLQSPKRTTDAVISHHAAGIVIVEQPTAVPACG